MGILLSWKNKRKLFLRWPLVCFIWVVRLSLLWVKLKLNRLTAFRFCPHLSGRPTSSKRWTNIWACFVGSMAHTCRIAKSGRVSDGAYFVGAWFVVYLLLQYDSSDQRDWWQGTWRHGHAEARALVHIRGGTSTKKLGRRQVAFRWHPARFETQLPAIKTFDFNICIDGDEI